MRDMFVVPPRVLVVLAGLTWLIGSGVLIVKGVSLLREAGSLEPSHNWHWLTAIGGVIVGSLKARFILVARCRSNLARIATLEEPRIWQFFRPGFFVALAAMITAGALLSRLAHGNYGFLISVALLDLSIGTALLGSSYVFRSAL